MHDILRERLWRNLEALPEERVYQVLDYVEFLSSKYARDGVKPPASSLRRFSERLEDHLRMQGVGLSAIRGTLGVMGTADKLVTDLADAGRTILKDVEDGLRSPTEPRDRTEVRNLPPAPPARESGPTG
ncbi:MAG TPA: hypothetical protein VMN39_03005 [Longimicrobiaceae bacterium]|nr:hypothetical protein [Longimicrobiaceae bacterium]